MKFFICAVSCFDEMTGANSNEALLKAYPFIKKYGFETEKRESGVELAFITIEDFAELADFMRELRKANADATLSNIVISLFGEDEFSLQIYDIGQDWF